jgi:hypothetical protein
MTDHAGADLRLEVPQRGQPVSHLLVALSEQRRRDKVESGPDGRAQPPVAVHDIKTAARVTDRQRLRPGEPVRRKLRGRRSLRPAQRGDIASGIYPPRVEKEQRRRDGLRAGGIGVGRDDAVDDLIGRRPRGVADEVVVAQPVLVRSVPGEKADTLTFAAILQPVFGLGERGIRFDFIRWPGQYPASGYRGIGYEVHFERVMEEKPGEPSVHYQLLIGLRYFLLQLIDITVHRVVEFGMQVELQRGHSAG